MKSAPRATDRRRRRRSSRPLRRSAPAANRRRRRFAVAAADAAAVAHGSAADCTTAAGPSSELRAADIGERPHGGATLRKIAQAILAELRNEIAAMMARVGCRPGRRRRSSSATGSPSTASRARPRSPEHDHHPEAAAASAPAAADAAAAGDPRGQWGRRSRRPVAQKMAADRRLAASLHRLRRAGADDGVIDVTSRLVAAVSGCGPPPPTSTDRFTNQVRRRPMGAARSGAVGRRRRSPLRLGRSLFRRLQSVSQRALRRRLKGEFAYKALAVLEKQAATP